MEYFNVSIISRNESHDTNTRLPWIPRVGEFVRLKGDVDVQVLYVIYDIGPLLHVTIEVE